MAETGELAGRIEQAASTLEGIERTADESGVEYAIAGVAFAAVGKGRASFRLRPDVAEAALHTPGVRTLDRGPGWIELVPAELDRFTVDRAISWFASAARYAAEDARARRVH